MKTKREWSDFQATFPGMNLWLARKEPLVDEEENDVGNLSAKSLTLNIPQ